MTKTKTSAERQAEYRLRRKAEGLKLVPNLWVHPDDIPKIRSCAQRLTRLRSKATP